MSLCLVLDAWTRWSLPNPGCQVSPSMGPSPPSATAPCSRSCCGHNVNATSACPLRPVSSGPPPPPPQLFWGSARGCVLGEADDLLGRLSQWPGQNARHGEARESAAPRAWPCGPGVPLWVVRPHCPTVFRLVTCWPGARAGLTGGRAGTWSDRGHCSGSPSLPGASGSELWAGGWRGSERSRVHSPPAWCSSPTYPPGSPGPAHTHSRWVLPVPGVCPPAGTGSALGQKPRRPCPPLVAPLELLPAHSVQESLPLTGLALS